VYEVADGTPAEQDTTMVTWFVSESNVTRAMAAGPRVTPAIS
jgi:hypothetical protein